jgi:hypothetical protein
VNALVKKARVRVIQNAKCKMQMSRELLAISAF